MLNSAPYARVVSSAALCGGNITFQTAPLMVSDPIASMARFFTDGQLQLFDEWDTLKPIVHEMAHLIAWNEIFGPLRSVEVDDPVDWFLKNLLSESFANTIELLVFCGDSQNQQELSRLTYRYAEMNLVADLMRILHENELSEIADALLATFFVSNFHPYSCFLRDEVLDGCYANLDVRIEPAVKYVLKSIVVPCKSNERIKTQNEYYSHFGFPDFGDKMHTQDLSLLLNERPHLKTLFNRLGKTAARVLKI